VVDLDAAFGKQLLDVAVRQREAQVPAHTERVITSGGKQKPRRQIAGREQGAGGRVLMTAVCLCGLAYVRCNSAVPCRRGGSTAKRLRL
jgi:hypothetical protein